MQTFLVLLVLFCGFNRTPGPHLASQLPHRYSFVNAKCGTLPRASLAFGCVSGLELWLAEHFLEKTSIRRIKP